jgi:ABC-type transport system involved in cytochrome bd biosynthesis fused ATPase/permease subunit
MVKVGCGKSSLLSALLGDMKRTRGVANLYGRVAYVAQQAWIQNNTLADNITFGKRFNNELYQKVRRLRCRRIRPIEGNVKFLHLKNLTVKYFAGVYQSL